MKILKLFIFSALVLLEGCISPYEAGRRDAQRDIAHNVLALEAFGIPEESFPDYERLLKQKYGVSIKWVASNDVPVGVLEHWKGYNEVSTSEIERRFGTNALQQAQTEARQLHEREDQSR